MPIGHVISNSAYYQNQYNADVPDELIHLYTSKDRSSNSLEYTEIDEMLDRQAGKQDETPELKIDDVYAPIHDWKWAAQKAFEGEHCICNPYPQYRLVYSQDKWTLRRYDKNGFTIETIDPTYEAMNCRSWRVWNWRKEVKNEK